MHTTNYNVFVQKFDLFRNKFMYFYEQLFYHEFILLKLN